MWKTLTSSIQKNYLHKTKEERITIDLFSTSFILKAITSQRTIDKGLHVCQKILHMPNERESILWKK